MHRQHEPYRPTDDLGGRMRALEASAGTGKTFAVTSNVLRCVVEGVGDQGEPLQMDRLLLVTFTRAATAELEDRVRRRLVDGHRALSRAAVEGDAWHSDDEVLQLVVDHARDHDGLDEAARRVEEALRTVDQATVTTIHGFCHQVLRQAAVHTDADPSVQIDTDDDRLVRAVVDDWMVRFTHDADAALVELLDDMRLKRGGLHGVGRVVAGEPDPYLAPEPPAADLDPVAELEAAHADLRRALTEADLTVAAAQAAKDDKEINGNSTWAPSQHRMLRRLDSLREELADGGRPSMSTLSGLDPEEPNSAGDLMPARIAATPLPQAVQELTATRARVETWIRRKLADDVRDDLRHRRELAGTASFADLLRQLAAALDDDTEGVITAAIGAQFDAVFVDEFQDTDPVQWSILGRLFGELDVFHVVGDPKQAIYGWRGADLATYQRALEDAEDRSRTMTRNWRSDAAYVDAMNRLLGHEGSLGGSVPYVRVDAAPGREGRLVDAEGTDRAGLQLTYLAGLGASDAANVRAAIAEDVAQDIVDAIESDLRIAGRPVRAADCAVLVRRHKEAAAVAAALRERDVPVVVGGGDDVLLSPEAQAMADLLRVLATPGDDRALRRVLVGPFIGLDGSELAALDEQQEQWQAYAVDVRRWATTWADHGIAAAVQRAIREGEAERRHARSRDGDRTMTNLRHLTELLHLAEQDEALGTHALAAWFDARRAEATEEQTPPERELRLERDDAAVQVLTVHAAKGLEFPLVWVPFLWTREGLGRDTPTPFVVNDPDNDNLRTVSLHAASTPKVRSSDPERVRLRQLHDLAEWEGGLRLAYVALTRAEHRCTVHLCNYDYTGSLPASPAWQLFWSELGDGRPGAEQPPPDKVWEDEDRLREQLRDLAEHPSIELVERPLEEARPRRALDAEAAGPRPQLAALTWQREERLDVAWGRSSYSVLLRARAAAGPEQAGATDEHDTDQHVPDPVEHGLGPLPAEAWEAEEPVPLADLPRGAAWGTYQHDVLEHARFTETRDELRDLAAVRARQAPIRVEEEHLDIVADGFHAALATPMGPLLDDLRLADLPRRDRLDELGFTLTIGSTPEQAFTLGHVADVFDRHDEQSDAPLAAAAAHLRAGGTGVPVHGLLTGFIDLTLRHPGDGRFWIADYKSNGLGQRVEPADEDGRARWVETEAHTTPERVMAAMLKGDYLLQAHLYVVALHRYLALRLGDAYDYDRHVGGWAYLFLRGMTGPDVRRTADGRPHGIAAGRPTRDLVEDLDRVLRGG